MVLQFAIAILISVMALIPLDMNKFELFTAQYLPHLLTNNVAKMHRQWYSALNDRSVQYLCMEAGRGSAKTTIGSVAFSLFNICESKDEDMQVASRSTGPTGTSTKIMRKVKRELEENELLIYDYGIKRGQDWGKEAIEVIRGDGHRIYFYSIGKHSSIRGSRGTVLIDDPQNSADCRSETVLCADEDWLLEDVLPVIINDQRLIFIATPISPLSLCSKVKSLPGFKVLSFPMEDPPHSGKSAWPEQYSDEFLAERLSVMGLDRYGAEYLCEPKVSGNPVFKPEWFKGYDPESVQFQRLRKETFYLVVGMDCAESKSDQADNTALVTLGAMYSAKPDVYILDVRANTWSTKEGAEQLFRVFDQYQQHKSVVESRVKPPGKDAMIEEIEERERIYGKYVNLLPVRPVKDKVTRAMYVQSMLQEGRVYFNKKDKEQQKLISELTMFTGDQNFHDDRVDALVHGLTEIKDTSLSREAMSGGTGPHIVTPKGWKPNKYTGVG